MTMRDERRTMSDWAFVALIGVFGVLFIALLLGIMFWIDVLVRGWPR